MGGRAIDTERTNAVAKWLRISEAMDRLGVKAPRTIKTYIEKGWLVGRQFPNTYWYVTEDSLDAFTSLEGHHAVQFPDTMLD